MRSPDKPPSSRKSLCFPSLPTEFWRLKATPTLAGMELGFLMEYRIRATGNPEALISSGTRGLNASKETRTGNVSSRKAMRAIG